MSEVIKDLPGIGQYDLELARSDGEQGDDIFSIRCSSADVALAMTIHFPAPGESVADSMREPGDAAYVLNWPTNLSKDEVVEVIREVSEEETDVTYFCTDYKEGEETDEEAGEESTVNVEAVASALGTLASETDEDDDSLEAILVPEFTELSVESDEFSVTWEEAGEGANFPRFSLLASDNYEITDARILGLIKRTIVAKQAGKVAAALENLNAIFNQYRKTDPATLAD